jgi:hypothetical protein
MTILKSFEPREPVFDRGMQIALGIILLFGLAVFSTLLF